MYGLLESERITLAQGVSVASDIFYVGAEDGEFGAQFNNVENAF